MPKWMISRALTLAGSLGIPVTGANSAIVDGGATFSTAAEARAYLLENPAGPEASAAIAALTEIRTDSSVEGVRVAQASADSIIQQNQNTAASNSYNDLGGGMY
jgi:hypothetical protein